MLLNKEHFGRVGSALEHICRFARVHKFSLGLSLVALSAVAIVLPLVGQGPVRERAEREQDSAMQIRRRAQWFFHQRAYPLNHIPAGARIRAVQHLEQMRAANGTYMQRVLANSKLRNSSSIVSVGARQIAINSSTWTPIGPAPTSSFFFNLTSGRVNALAVDPCDASGNTIYAGAAQGGLWKTTDGGNTWAPLTDSQLSISSGSVAVDPGDCTGGHTGAIYYGTGEENFAFDSFYGAGVLISHDGGATWTKDNTFVSITSGTPSVITPTNPVFAGPFIGSLAVDAATSGSNQVLLAGIQGISSPIDSGIYRSTDGGADWTRVLPTSNMLAPNDFGTGVLFDPNDATGQTAYAALGVPFCTGANNACGMAGDEELDNGVYKSTDGGNTWTLLSGLNNAAQSVGGPASYGRITIAIGPPVGSSPVGELIVTIADITGQSSDLLGTFLSTDGGNTFTQLPTPSFCDHQCFYDMSAAISPSNPNLILLGGGPAASGIDSTTGNPITSQCGQFPAESGISTVIRSADGGNTWLDASCDNSTGTFLHVDTHAFAFSPNGSLYTGNDGGVWSSSDVISGGAGSQHWSDLNTSLNLTQFYPGISIHPSNPEIGFSGAQDNGTQIFNGSLNWSDTEVCGDGGWTAIDPSTPSTVYAGCAATGSGEVNKNQLDGTPGTNVSNWTTLDTPGMDTDNQNFIPPLVLDPSTPQNLYFGTFQVWQSVNGGISWNVVAPSASTGPSAQCANNSCVLTTLAVAPNNSNTLYVGTDAGLMWVSTNVTNATPSFAEIDQSTTPGRTVTQIVVSPTVSTTAFAAFSGFSGFTNPNTNATDTLGHLFETTNSGSTWTDISCHNAGNCGSPLTTDLPNTPVNDVVVDPDDVTNNTLYVATDVGVFITTNGGASWSELATGLPHVECTSLKLDEAARALRVGTHGRGDWDLQLPFAAGITSALTGILPTSAAAGSPSFTLTLTGIGFPANPAVNFGSTPLTVASATATQITANIPASALASSGEVAVSVNGAQNSLNFGIEGPVPTLSNNPPPSPSTIRAGSNVTLTVTGTNFVSNSEVIWTPQSGTNANISTALAENSGSLSCNTAAPPVCTFTVTVPASLIGTTLAHVSPMGSPKSGPQRPASPWFLAALCIAILGIAALFAFPRKRRALISATLGMVILLSPIGGCSNANNTPPINLGAGPVQVTVNVNNPAPGGGLSNGQAVTVNPQ